MAIISGRMTFLFFFASQLLRCCNGEVSSFNLPSYKTAASVLDTLNNTISSLSSSSSDCSITSCINCSVFTLRLLMRCTSPGFHNVIWNIENESFSYWVPFDNTPYCYSWKTSYAYNINTTSFSLIVWISDHNNKSITVPPNVLTQQFRILGEYPRVVPNDNNMFVQSLGSNNRYWEYQLTGLSAGVYSYSLTISDSIVSLLDCTVRSTSVTVSKTKYYINPLITELPQETTSFNDTVRMFRDPAAPSVAIVTRGAINIITQDDFRTHSVFQVNRYRGSIEDVAYTSTSILMLIDQEIITLINSSSSFTSPSGLLSMLVEGNSFHIAGRGRSLIHDNYDLVITWSHMSMVLYISVDGGGSFNNVTMPTAEGNLTIQSLQVHPVKDEVSILAYGTNNNTLSLCYNVRQNEWSNTTLSVMSNNSQPLLMEYFPSPYGDRIVWGRQSLYYSPTGDELLPLTILQNQSATYEWRDNEYIRHVVTGSSGQVGLVLSDDSLFYGRIATGEILKVLYYVNRNSTVYFDSVGNLKIFSILESGVNVTVATVPILSLLLSALYPPLACPYLHWTHNVASLNKYYIDYQDTAMVWATLVPRVWSPNNISVSFTNSLIVRRDIQSTEEQTAVQGSVKRNMSVAISPVNDYTTGYTVMRLSPVTHSLSCDQLAEENVELFVGCPPDRHIKIMRTNNRCNEFEDYMFTIPNDRYDPELKGRSDAQSLQDKVVQYNVMQWGCPVRIPYDQNYKPVLFLYDGDSVRERVEVDYVVREIHGRTDFSYTATAGDVGCRRKPQTWKEMLAHAKDPYKAWTHQKYQSCFEGGTGSLSSPDTPYQILNNSNGGSYLRWRSRNAIYVFQVTVIARNYSFCNLTVLFAVQVYALPNLSYVAYILYIVTCLTSGLVLFLSFLLYKRFLFAGSILLRRKSSKTIMRSSSSSSSISRRSGQL